MQEICDHNILSILPRYTRRGDKTVIIDIQGQETLYPFKVNTILNRIGSRRCKDLRLLRAWAQALLYQQLWLPLGFDWELILMPMKVRKPTVSGDTTIGYFNFAHFHSLRQRNNKLYLVMNHGREFLLYWNLNTVRNHLRNARLISHVVSDNMHNSFYLKMMHTTGIYSMIKENSTFLKNE